MDWCSGLTSRLGLRLGGGAAGSIPRSAFVFYGGENVCVHSLCMGLKFKLLLEQKKGISLSYVVFVLFPSEGVDSYNDPVLSGLHTHLL